MWFRAGFIVALLCVVALANPVDVGTGGASSSISGSASVSPTGASVTVEMVLAADPDFQKFLELIRSLNLTHLINDPAAKTTVLALINVAVDAVKTKLNFDQEALTRLVKSLILLGKFTKNELLRAADLLKQRSDTAAALLDAAVAQTQSAGGNFATALSNALQNAAGQAQQAVQAAANAATQAGQAAANAANQAGQAAANAGTQAGQAATGALNQAGQAATAAGNQGQQTLAQMQQAARDALASLAQKLRQLGKTIHDAIKSLLQTPILIKKFQNALTAAGGEITQSIDAGNSIVHKITDALPPPPEVPETVADFLAKGTAAQQQVLNAIKDNAVDLYNKLNDRNAQLTVILPTLAQLQELLTKPSAEIADFFKSRVLEGIHSFADLKNALTVTATDGSILQIQNTSDTEITIGGKKISTQSAYNVRLTNAVLHQEVPQ